MIYLDYSATTNVDERVLKRFNKVVKENYANPNSIHDLGLKSNSIITSAIDNISKYLKINSNEIIFTSGASESNNTAIKGIYEKYNIKHIITTKLEHSSVIAPINYLTSKGVRVSFLNLDKNGIVDINELKSLINKENTLVTICAVNSELGIREPIEEIGKELIKYDNVIFHSDITQCLGKDKIDLTNVDLASFSAHKIYSFKGIGGLIIKDKYKIIPLIHGGKSTSVFRSGTPQTELIDSISTALNLLMPTLEEDYLYVKSLNDLIKKELLKYNNIHINSTKYSLPHILNFSIIGTDSLEIQKYFNKRKIYISTQTACSTNNKKSTSVYEIYKNELYAFSSVRISLSKYTKEEEVIEFIKVLKELLGEINGNN